MQRHFVRGVLLPLVDGGPLLVGRPITLSDVSKAFAAWTLLPDQDSGADTLTELRTVRARALLPGVGAPPLDLATWRLGAAVHNLLCLSHPAVAGRGRAPLRRRISEAALELADLGAPTSAFEAVSRYTLLARLPEVVQPTPTRDSSDGRWEPRRFFSFTRSRAPKNRAWLAEVGIAPEGQSAWQALLRASPLIEALEPLRLEPPWTWEHVLPVLRFPVISRLVAGRVLALGRSSVGSTLSRALLKHASRGTSSDAGERRAEEVAFGIRFLAHVAWLDVVLPGGSASVAPPPAAGEPDDLQMLLLAALDAAPALVFPPDVAAESALAQRFRRHLPAPGEASPRLIGVVRGLCRVALGSGSSPPVRAP